MSMRLPQYLGIVVIGTLAGMIGSARGGDDASWIDLIGERGLEAWKEPKSKWVVAGEVGIDAKNSKRLSYKIGMGILVNGATGRAHDLLSRENFGDIEAHVEFLIPKGSNSGVKFEGLYEIQIFDSFGKKKATASDCGGIYPRAEREPTYHHIDAGTPPRVNAARRPGEWQTLEVSFLAPRFDAAGNKMANARVVKVVLNDQLIHENVEVKTPTGAAWHDKEIARGPLLLQGDHGPVAFRQVRVRPYNAKRGS
jgi:hypothetical protein